MTTAPAAREAVDGVLDRDAILCQMQAALELLERERPDRVVTLGGECSVSVAPFTYLARRYADDMAVVWIDAHPDITLPGDAYAGFHAMALTACMGRGDARWPRTAEPSGSGCIRAVLRGSPCISIWTCSTLPRSSPRWAWFPAA